MPTIYQGMQWTGVRYRRKEYANAKQPKSGYRGAFIPDGSSHAAYFRDDASLCTEFPNSVFTLVSITACAAWNDDLQLTITGHRRSTQVDTHTLILLFGKPQMIFLQWENIDKVIFKPSGGALHSESGGAVNSAQVVLTQLILCEARE